MSSSAWSFWKTLHRAVRRDEQRRREMLYGDDVDEAEAMRLAQERGNPLWRLFKRYYLGRHLRTVLLTTFMASLLGLVTYGYGLSSKFIADDIVEIGLLTHDVVPATQLDPTLLTESRLFALDEPHLRTGVVMQHDESLGRTREEKLILLGWLALALLLLEAARHGVAWLVLERTVYLTQEVQFRLRQHLHDKFQQLPMSYHDSHSPGRLLTHLFSDMNVISSTLNAFLRMLPEAFLGITTGVCLLLWLDFWRGLLVILALPLYAMVYSWFSKYLKVLSKDVREREGLLNAQIANRVSHFQVVKAYGRETGEAISFLRKARPILQQHLGIAVFSTVFNVVCAIISTSAMGIALWTCATRCRDGLMSPGELLLFYSAVGYLFTPVTNLTSQAGVLHKVTAVAAKAMRVLDEPVTLTDPEQPAAPLTQAPEVRFDNVSFRYEGSQRAALKNVSFTIGAGQRVCVMGPSGCGKTTIAKLACRFYDPTEGAVTFDGINIRRFRIADLRDIVGFVSQEPIVFSGTIADNIRYGSEQADERRIIRSAQYAQIHDHIEQLPAKYRTLTQERGLTLSGGQKQRVNLARTLLQQNHFLVLDDCTSALDADTESRLIEALKTVLQQRTALLVSHRVSVALACDHVLMLREGEVVEFGPPRELLQQNGAFAAVHQKQVEKAREAELQASAAAGLILAGVTQ